MNDLDVANNQTWRLAWFSHRLLFCISITKRNFQWEDLDNTAIEFPPYISMVDVILVDNREIKLTLISVISTRDCVDICKETLGVNELLLLCVQALAGYPHVLSIIFLTHYYFFFLVYFECFIFSRFSSFIPTLSSLLKLGGKEKRKYIWYIYKYLFKRPARRLHSALNCGVHSSRGLEKMLLEWFLVYKSISLLAWLCNKSPFNVERAA